MNPATVEAERNTNTAMGKTRTAFFALCLLSPLFISCQGDLQSVKNYTLETTAAVEPEYRQSHHSLLLSSPNTNRVFVFNRHAAYSFKNPLPNSIKAFFPEKKNIYFWQENKGLVKLSARNGKSKTRVLFPAEDMPFPVKAVENLYVENKNNFYLAQLDGSLLIIHKKKPYQLRSDAKHLAEKVIDDKVYFQSSGFDRHFTYWSLFNYQKSPKKMAQVLVLEDLSGKKDSQIYKLNNVKGQVSLFQQKGQQVISARVDENSDRLYFDFYRDFQNGEARLTKSKKINISDWEKIPDWMNRHSEPLFLVKKREEGIHIEIFR